MAAIGGNALLMRGQPLTAENQRSNAVRACRALAPLALEHELVIVHGNGPQIGLLALQGQAYSQVDAYPLDVLTAETQGMIGYMVMQELGNLLPVERPVVTLLTMVEVDSGDPAFAHPSKPIGPQYRSTEAAELASSEGWMLRSDGDGMRRVVPSPPPRRIFGVETVVWLLERGAVVICAGGGGIPTVYAEDPSALAGGRLSGVEAVIDKDLVAAKLAGDLQADALLILTDVDAVYEDWRTPAQRPIAGATAARMRSRSFESGSMGPKVAAACNFVQGGGAFAAIGSIDDAWNLLEGHAGTRIMAADEHRGHG